MTKIYLHKQMIKIKVRIKSQSKVIINSSIMELKCKEFKFIIMKKIKSMKGLHKLNMEYQLRLFYCW